MHFPRPSRLVRVIAIGGLTLSALFGISRHTEAERQSSVVTFYYPTGSTTYSGIWPYWGSAGASWNIPLGTLIRLHDGHVVMVIDRGNVGWSNWVDVYCPYELASYCLNNYGYGPYEIEFLRWGWGE